MSSSILLLDDESTVLDVVSEYISGLGFDVVACNEIEAAEALLNCQEFDAVLTDLRISELGGLEGMRLIRYVATHFPHIIIMTMSGFITPEIRTLATDAGASVVLDKPLDFKNLAQTLMILHADSRASGSINRIEALEDILSNKAVFSLLQPIVELGSEKRQTFGFESLARAQPCSSPLRNPEILFDYASRKEMLFETDMVCVESALAAAQEINGGAKLFINVQPRAMSTVNFVPRVCELTDAAKFDNRQIVFEITEQRGIINPVAFAATIEELRSAGFGCALDDYGVGFANVQLIRELRPDYLKISGYFCKNIHIDETKQTILRNTAEMAHQLNIPTIQENVETEDELEMIRSLGVDFGQGYYFSRPEGAQFLKTSGFQ